MPAQQAPLPLWKLSLLKWLYYLKIEKNISFCKTSLKVSRKAGMGKRSSRADVLIAPCTIFYDVNLCIELTRRQKNLHFDLFHCS